MKIKFFGIIRNVKPEVVNLIEERPSSQRNTVSKITGNPSQ